VVPDSIGAGFIVFRFNRSRIYWFLGQNLLVPEYKRIRNKRYILEKC